MAVMTIVRMKVAAVEFMSWTPIFANIAVSAAKTADNIAHVSHELISGILSTSVFVKSSPMAARLASRSLRGEGL
jgi:hypothetical protein